MTKKGTGWIPDYPDVKDYTLETDEIQGVVSRVRREQVTSTIEDITIKFTDALRLLATPGTRDELTKLTDEIEKRVLGDVSFNVARIHKVLKLNMFAPEVLLIKNYLQRISQKSEGFGLSIGYKSETVTDALFDQDTDTAIRAFQTSQKNLLVTDGVVDIDTMIALREVVSALEGGNETLIRKWIQLSQDKPEVVTAAIGEDCLEYFKCLSRLIAAGQLNDEWRGINSVTKDWVTFYLKNSKESNAAPAWNVNQVFSYLTHLQSKDDAVINDFPKLFEELLSSFDTLTLEESSEKAGEVKSSVPNSKTGESRREKFSKCLEDFETNWNEIIEELKVLSRFLQYLSDNSPEHLKVEAVSSDRKDAKVSKSSTKKPKVTQPVQTKPEGDADFIKTLEQKLEERYFEKNQEKCEKGNAAFKTVMQQLTHLLFPAVLPRTERKEQAISAPLPPQVFEFVSKKLISQEFDGVYIERLYQIIRPIASAIAQIISPLGQHSNLQVALEEGFKTFEEQFSQAQKTTAQRTLLGNPQSAVTSGKTNFQNIASDAVQELEEMLFNSVTDELADPTNQTALYAAPQKLNSIKELQTKLDQYVESGGLKLEKNSKNWGYCVKQRKKKLLEIIDPKLGKKGSEYLQVPLTRKLKQEIESLKSIDDSISADNPSEDGNKVYLFLPEFVDLSFWCSAIEDQGSLNSCTAHAGVALTEYFAKRSFGRYVDVSALFLYKVTRELMHRQGDAGASVRETMKAMVLFGVPPEEHWSYPEHSAEDDPSPFCYSFAQTYQALKYFRLDHAGISKYALLTQIQITLVAGFPCMFGFTIYSSIYSDANMKKGYIPYPGKADKVEGGHAVVAVGYDDSKVIDNADGRRSEGALLIRNSWGTAWGEGGYGWLPYDYVLNGLTADWWSLVRSEWFETGQFGIGSTALGDPLPGQK
jgi:C1A family cysteine protease